jgi:hypothetical protein
MDAIERPTKQMLVAAGMKGVRVRTPAGNEFTIKVKSWKGGPPYGYGVIEDGESRPKEGFKLLPPHVLEEWFADLEVVRKAIRATDPVPATLI